MRPIRTIIIHCSDSDFGDAKTIDAWHRERGWTGIGYHAVITNGCLKHGETYNPIHDGVIQPGRPVESIGAHCKGHNADSIGICLIGTHFFTSKQLQSLQQLLRKHCAAYSIKPDSIHTHYEFDQGKTCPNIDITLIRDLVRTK